MDNYFLKCLETMNEGSKLRHTTLKKVVKQSLFGQFDGYLFAPRISYGPSKLFSIFVELRQYKNDSTSTKIELILNLPFF